MSPGETMNEEEDAQRRLLAHYETRAQSCTAKIAEIRRELDAGTWPRSGEYGRQQISRLEAMARDAEVNAERLRRVLPAL
jgi:hypothetical protein